MSNVGIIAKRELRSYFTSPVAYVVMTGFVLLLGFLFAFSVYQFRQATLQPVFSNGSVLLLFIAPVLTMRLLAEEQRSGTIELMLTSPVRDFEMVLGKFLACLAVLGALLVLTLWFVLVLFILGNPDPGPILGGYLGLFLFGASFLAVGLFASVLTQNQVVSAVIGFGILLLLYMIEAAGNFMGGSAREVLSYVAITPHLEDFAKGVIDTKDVIYYLSLVGACLFMTTTVLQVRRWR